MNFRFFPHFRSLYSRFILRVLLPPLGVLLVISLVGLYLLNNLLHDQAVNTLRRSADTTASTLQRELTLRETVLKQTGSELYLIKNEYNQGRARLERNRTACRSYIQQTGTHINAPNGVCDQFRGGLADSTTLNSFDRTYRELGEALIKNHDQRISERLTAYKQFFPETMALLILNNDASVVSSAYSGAFNDVEKIFKADAAIALKKSVYGKIMTVQDFRLAVFAFQIPGGSVLAAYNINDEHFLQQTWDEAPVDKNQVLVTILGNDGKPIYPRLKNTDSFTLQNASSLRTMRETAMNLDSIEHIVVASPVGPPNGWQVAVASPAAVVLMPVRDALLTTVLIIGLLMVVFLWLGTFFIRHTSRNIVDLVHGAQKFGDGHLHHKIKLHKHSESELLQLADTMNSMARHIAADEREIDEKNREFTSIATHELRAPLTAIIGNLTLLKEKNEAKLDSSMTQKIDHAYAGATRLRDLVNDMLDVSHLESRTVRQLPLKPVDISVTINDVLSAMSILASNSNIKVTYDSANASKVTADTQLLHIIMNNFVSNALKYSRPNDTVTISHRIEGKYLATTIADTGLGIPKDQQEHIFEKFFRVKLEDRANITGTGLGMYIVKHYIEQMHGHVSFTSVHGKGTQFTFWLPLAPAKTIHHKRNSR